MSKQSQTGSRQMRDLVIFDFDGTLADTSHVFIEAFNKAAPSVGGVPYKHDEAARWQELDVSEVLYHHGVVPKHIPQFVELMRKEMSSHVSDMHLFPNTLSVLSELASNGHTLAIVTSNSRQTVTSVIGKDFNSLFSASSFDTPIAGKEEALRHLTSENKVAVADTHYVGDELRDFEAASAAGINFVGVSWGFNTAHSLQSAGCRTIIHDLSELGAKLPSLSQSHGSEDLTKHLNALYGYAMILSRDSATASDLVQDTYVRALAAKDRLWENSAVKSWLFTILRNIWLNHLRKTKGEQSFTANVEAVMSDGATGSPEPSLNPGVAYEQKAAREMVRAALAQLPQEFREVVLLREFEDLPYQEIADILGCPPGTVMSRLARARAKLRTLLAAAPPTATFSGPVVSAPSSLVEG